ncbi:MAG: hypothetical protein A2Z20_08525 [Bdellovibrionales bacterium RBG_16_40_8]|nr:MAG: hypothetical protein A2Z20_08525 [Bdellovibrionales bacterium RBG_16_40_8]
MKKWVGILLSVQIALAPYAANSYAAADDSASPVFYQNKYTIKSPDGETYTSDSIVVFADNAKQKERAEKWYLGEIKQARNEIRGKYVDFKVTSISTDDPEEIAEANELNNKLPNDINVETAVVKKSLLKKVESVWQKTMAKVKKPFAKWVAKSPGQSRALFSLTRGTVNGVLSSYIFDHFYMNGDVPTWLAWTAGMSLGAISGTLNYFAKTFYAPWLDRNVSDKTYDFVSKLLPFMKHEWVNELSSIGKWSMIEIMFIGLPILMLQFGPVALGMGDGYPYRDSLTEGLVAATWTLLASISAQYAWEKGIARANNADLKYTTDKLSEDWIQFRTTFMLALISMLQVPAVSLSLGDYFISSLMALGVLSATGLVYRHKVVKRTNARDIEEALKQEKPVKKKDCKDILSSRFVLDHIIC